jgi:hypothetical protein
MIAINNSLFKNRDNVTIVTVILISLFISRAIYSRQMVKYHQLIKETRIEQEKGAILDRLVGLNAKIKKYKERSWNAVDFNSIVGKISNLALESQVKIFDITPGARKDENHYLVIPLFLNGEATYKNFLGFLKNLETNKMFLRVKSLQLSPQTGEALSDKGLIIRINLSIQAIYLK